MEENRLSEIKPNASCCQKVEMVSESRGQAFATEWYQFASESHFWFQWRLTVLLRSLMQLGVSQESELNVLEVGCGTGSLRAQLESATNWTVNGTDLDISALSCIKPARGKTMYYDILEERAPYVGSYDIVVLFDVLEHIQETQPFLSSLLRHLKPGGLLLLNVPALQPLYSNYDEIVGHLRRYNKQSISQEFTDLNFKIELLRYWGFSLVPLVALRKLILGIFAKQTTARKIECGFKPPNSWLEGILRMVQRAETSLLRDPPIGTSILMIGRKL